MKKILITGGTGFIGSHTCLLLLEKGFDLLIVDSLVNSSPNVINRLKSINNENKNNSKIDFIKGDLRDENFLDNLFKRYSNNEDSIEAVIHFAGLKAVGESTFNPIKYWDYNLKGTINLLKIMERFCCFKLIFSSSATIYGTENDNNLIKENNDIKPINPYGNTKATIEKILDDLNKSNSNKWSIISLRYFNPIGAHQSGLIGENPLEAPNNILPIINNVALGLVDKLEIFGNDWDTKDGTGVRDYIHVMDLAEGHCKALDNVLINQSQFLQINLGNGLGTSVLELVKTFQKVNNVVVPYIFTSRRVGDVAFSVADNSMAKILLNWYPRRDLETMCEDSWRWFKDNPKGI